MNPTALRKPQWGFLSEKQKIRAKKWDSVCVIPAV